MSGSQKAGAASFEPVGAAVTQFVKNGAPVAGEVFGIAFLVVSAVMAIFLKESQMKVGPKTPPTEPKVGSPNHI